MVKDIKETQYIEQFFMLNRNRYFTSLSDLESFDWSLTFRYIKDKFDEISVFDSQFNSFKIKLCAEELSTQDNLCKCSPSVYIGKIVHNSKAQLFNLISPVIQDKVDIDYNDIFTNINNLDCWNSSNIRILSLVKGIIPRSFSEFLKELKIPEQSIYKIMREVIDTLVLQFKHLIWEYRNVY
ncbi:hypothetical protein GLOIN_2v1870638 [Rhizophagus clarus]|uniref:Uncharacterized protein n=1 Tax=Rhizophagus clarus TaxID=94130 RepID=A0A8H3QIC2_9GLOM|nr:hypothetical protein GLOIN_2v1870638 [Rhizophagus clarus]